VKIKPREQRVYSMSKDFVQILNSHAVKIGEAQVRWDDLCNAFPLLKDKPKPEGGEMRVMTSVHCECTITTHLWRIAPNQREIEIGVSKHCCWLCEEYLKFLSQAVPRTKFLVSGYQGKIHSRWHPPSWLTEPIRRMADLLSSEIAEILGKIIRTNRSDSYPRSPISGNGSPIPEDYDPMEGISDDMFYDY
jgi:OTT_1508-like deaminase